METQISTEHCMVIDSKLIVTPKLVMAMARDSYDYFFWVTVKKICDDHGDCHLSTAQLAKQSAISVGKVVDCRKYLIDSGLLAGEMVKVKSFMGSFGHRTWRLWIPDFSDRNLDWCIEHPTPGDMFEWRKVFEVTIAEAKKTEKARFLF